MRYDKTDSRSPDLTMDIITFDIDIGRAETEPWFAIPASKLGKRGTFEFIKAKFDAAEFSWPDVEGTYYFLWKDTKERYLFTRKDYKWIKEFVKDPLRNTLYSGRYDGMPSAIARDDILEEVSFELMKFRLEGV